MEFGATTYGLGYLAGAVSTLSPCVLPLLPILIASAVAAHRWGTWALAVGLALSYAGLGLLWATLGAALGLDPDTLRWAGAVLMLCMGLVLALPALQRLWQRAGARWGAAGGTWLARLPGSGWSGQFAVGAVLGVVWTPCVGPTLGSALALAAQGGHAGATTLLMLVFGLGAATPMLLLGGLSRQATARLRGTLARGGRIAQRVLGLVLVLIAALVLSGADRVLQAWLLDRTPAWLVDWTTRW
jgi:cytochrome c biogenesis protein CcdA